MSLNLAIILIVLASLLSVAATGFIGDYLRTKKQNLQLRADIEALKNRRRHTYATDNGLLDIRAVLNDLLQAAQEEQLNTEARKIRTRQAIQILEIIQQGPLAYDSDRPAGPKPEKK